MMLLARRYEREPGAALHALLQVGDFGAFPDTTRLDRSTARFARHDPDELGFSRVIRGLEASDLLEDASYPVLWVRGNHEDFEYLSRYRQPSAVDPAGTLIFLPDGTTQTVAGVTVGGLGGKPPPAEERGRGRKARRRFRRSREDRADPRIFATDQAARVFAGGGPDILLTHAGPCCDAAPWGSTTLTRLAERVRPRVHLFGHHHAVIGPTTGPGGGMLVGLEHLEFHRGTLRPGGWGILEIDANGPSWRWGHELPWSVVGTHRYREELA